MTLTGANSGSQAGVYTSPYTATIDGATGIAVICDDFTSDTYFGETWTANVTNLSILASGPSSILR